MNTIINTIEIILCVSSGFFIITLIMENKRLRRKLDDALENAEYEAKRATKWFDKYVELRNGIQSVMIPKDKPKQDPP